MVRCRQGWGAGQSLQVGLLGSLGCPTFVGQINHFGDGDIDSLAAFKLWRHRAKSEGDLVAFQWDEVALDIRDVDKMLG